MLPVWGKRSFGTRLKSAVGKFKYHFTYSRRFPAIVRVPWDMLFAIVKGLWLHYVGGRAFDVIISYGTNRTGMAAVVLKWLTGAKLIVEMPGAPAAAYLYDSAARGRWTGLKHLASWGALKIVLCGADGVKLLYPDQLSGVRPPRSIPIAVFHNLVPVSAIKPTDADEKYVLFVGGPWYLKGVDILIKAFQQISHEFPDHKLFVVGYTLDQPFFDALRGGDDRIEFRKGVKPSIALDLISACSVFVLPSRSEAMGRVLLEAMALRKPIIASRVDGIPSYIEDGRNGLLFEREDVEELASRLKRVLADREVAERLARNGYETVHDRFSEAEYAKRFDEMIDAVLGRN